MSEPRWLKEEPLPDGEKPSPARLKEYQSYFRYQLWRGPKRDLFAHQGRSSPVQDRVYKFLKDSGPKYTLELAAELRMKPDTLRDVLKRLVDAKRVQQSGKRIVGMTTEKQWAAV